MNEVEGKTSATKKTRQVNASGVLSIFLPLLGFVIGYDAAHSGRRGYDGVTDLFTGFALWLFLSLVGAICAFVSFRYHDITAISCFGLFLCLLPFLLLLAH